MKFWQKTFICTLVLFLICFGGGIFSLALFFNGQLVENCENTCLAEQFYIAKSFSADCEYTASTGGSIKELMMSYSEYYSEDGIELAIEYGDVKNELAEEELARIAFETELSDEEDSRIFFQRRVGGVRYIFVKSLFSGGSITYIKDISYLDDDWQAIALIFVSIGVCVSAVLAIVLFVMLKKLASPLSKLTAGTAAIAKGDYSVRTDVKGNDEFADLSKGFNYMTEQISDQISALELVADQKQQLVDDLSHEMRTPLTSIHGYAEYLLNAAVDEEERIDALMCITSESERLARLSQSLLDISYVSRASLEKTDVRLEDIFTSIERRFEIKLRSSGTELILESGGLSIRGDATLIDLLISNLTDNAVKACRDSEVKQVKITAESFDRKTVITVSDSGKGMDEEELKHITEPFYRTDRVRSRADGGAGLGLTLCKRIVDAHGGEMSFTSAPGKGTKVLLTFAENEKQN